MIQFTTLPELSLYVHLPWCVRKCPYCDFNSHEARESIPEKEYLAALIADLEASLPMVWGRPVVSSFYWPVVHRAFSHPMALPSCCPPFAPESNVCPMPRSRWRQTLVRLKRIDLLDSATRA